MFLNGYKHGKGSLKMSNRKMFTGIFAFDKKVDYGLLKISDSEKYEGDLKNEMFSGNVTYCFGGNRSCKDHFVNNTIVKFSSRAFQNGVTVNGNACFKLDGSGLVLTESFMQFLEYNKNQFFTYNHESAK